MIDMVGWSYLVGDKKQGCSLLAIKIGRREP